MGATIAGGLVSTTTRRMTAVNIHLRAGLNGPPTDPVTMARRREPEAVMALLVPDTHRLKIESVTLKMDTTQCTQMLFCSLHLVQVRIKENFGPL